MSSLAKMRAGARGIVSEIRSTAARIDKLAALGILYVVIRVRRKRLPEATWFYRAVIAAGPAAVVALVCGWIVTEVGRQPWVVYGVMRTSEAITNAGGVPVGYGTLVLVYLGLIGAVAWILRRLASVPLEEPAESRPLVAHGG